MVTFISLFLGLILGEHPIELAAGETVATIELRLDDEKIATLRGAPWQLDYDFGNRLQPHELVAIARDHQGEEVARTQQWINMPRPPAEAGVVLEFDPATGRRRARLSWESLIGEEPIRFTASLDGRPLVATDPRAIPLPSFDAKQFHFFRAELHFSEQVSSTVEATFGDVLSDTIQARLTAVPIRYRGHKPPTLKELAGKLQVRGEAVEVVAIEEGIGEAIFLVDFTAYSDLALLTFQKSSRLNQRWMAPLKKNQQMRTVRTFLPLDSKATSSFELFPASAAVTTKKAGVLHQLVQLQFRKEGEVTQRLADVVAAAGTMAAATQSRRHVILILGEGVEDHSVIDPEVAAQYLQALQVPLSVWSLTLAKPGPHMGWSDVARISTTAQFERAIRDLVRDLNHQAIVWVKGKHLPQHFQLAGKPGKVELVR